MKTILVLTVISEDRPGLVDKLSKTIVKHDANWENSRMARLAGRFAGILLVSVADDRADELEKALHGLAESAGMSVVVQRSAADDDTPDRRAFHLQLVGTDHPGIIHDISHVLAARQVNVEDMRSDCEAAPMGGGQLFRMTATLTCVAATDMDELRTAIESVANDLMVDISLETSDS